MQAPNTSRTIELRFKADDGHWVAETLRVPPPDSPFRCRLFAVSALDTAWDVLNGRMIRRPPFHRLPRERFESKQHERGNEFHHWCVGQGISPLQQRLMARRKKRETPSYWWGEHARMRIPARKGMARMRRRLGAPVSFIKWRP